MKDIAFVSDLDSTLIFSKRQKIDSDVCIEYLDGNEQSFMTKNSIEKLSKAMKIAEFIPLTSRSFNQYNRIQFNDNTPKYALIANGAILLVDKKIDEAWLKESKKLMEPWNKEMEEIYKEIKSMSGVKICYMINDLFPYVSFYDETLANKCKEHFNDKVTLDIGVSGRKVYFTPPTVSKGEAVNRLRKAFGIKSIISAGDSDLDISMLEKSDYAIAINDDLTKGFNDKKPKFVFSGNGRFSDYIFESIDNIINEVK